MERPPHAYVPGRSPRHPEGLFDAVRDTAEGVPVDRLAETEAWRTGLRWIDEGYFWEAHEVLEPVWMAAPPNAPERSMVRAAIQCANARLKRRMGRDRAAARLEGVVAGLLDEVALSGRSRVMGLGLDEARARFGGADSVRDMQDNA
ncbi:DUF309 domain-containing protein [Rhodosalinus halophilus]|uniref:DUF309 domain-containing protein n=1 Tax=Rhodosalinus halophilus TaxID=2259333 RepID=A0A365U7Q6_9RHOB|nr:DUF309 domain-containing protein [Rhodosalinus halophilus]RBI83860.1 DUF309 domain-containing protein [Rhodosalinus halophilus]